MEKASEIKKDIEPEEAEDVENDTQDGQSAVKLLILH
jgi:hypothetical protein